MPIPTVTARSGGEQTASSTSHPITLPSFSIGQLLLVQIVFGNKCLPSISSGSGWNHIGRINNGIITWAGYWKIASGTGDNLTITSDIAQQSVHNSWAITGGYYIDVSPSQLTSGTFNSITPVDRWSADYLSIGCLTANGSVPNITAPAGYSNLVVRTPTVSPTTSATLATAELGVSNITSAIASATFGGTGIPLVYNSPIFAMAVSECDPAQTGHPRVYSREVTDLTQTAITSHSIRIPPNIQTGDLIISHFVTSGNTTVSIDRNNSGTNWDLDTVETHGTVTDTICYRVADGGSSALTLTTGAASKSHTMTVVIKGWSRIIESDPSGGNFVKTAAGTSIDQSKITYTDKWKKLLFLRSFAMANSNWYSAGTNGITGFPLFNNGASVGWGEWGLGLDDGINWSVTNTFTENTIIWNNAIEGYQMNALEFIGWKVLTFAGTNSNQTVTLSSVTDISGNTASVRAGDLVLVGFATASTVDRAIGMVSSGWTQIDTKRYVNGTSYDVNMCMFWKIMGDTPDSSVVLTGSLNNADAGAINVQVWRGANQASPIDNFAFTSGTGTTLPTPSYIEYIKSGTMPVQFAAMAAAGTGDLVPADNWYYIVSNSTDTNSISATLNHDVPGGIKRFIPGAFTGGPTAAAGNAWGAYTIGIKPSENTANTFTWTHETNTLSNIYFRSTTSAPIVSQTGQKGSQCVRILPNNYNSILYTEQLPEKKFWVQARVNIVVTQNPTTNSTISLFGLHSQVSNTNEWTSFTVRANVSTTGQITFSARHDANTIIISSPTIYSQNTWNYLGLLVDYSNFYSSPMTFRINGVDIGTVNIRPSLWKPHMLVGKTSEIAGSTNWNGFVYLDNMQYSANTWPAYPTGRPKVYNGTSWVNKPLKRWTGSAWVEEPMYYWNGVNWEYVT